MNDSYAVIIPYLRPIQGLIEDDEISEVMVNGDRSVWIERDGRIEYVVLPTPIDAKQLAAAVRNIARVLGDEINEASPLLSARLPDGSRVAAVLDPTSVGGTVLTIRKFPKTRFSLRELVAREMLTVEMMGWLVNVIQNERGTILISGGTGAGKTSLLNALTAYLPVEDRVVLIEDTAEVVLESPNLVRLEARRAQDGLPEVSIRDLLRHTLRLRPDRIVLGEVRGPEAFDLLQALNTGHEGTLSTIHANNARLALSRFRTCVAMAGVDVPDSAVARNIGEVVQVVVHIERRAGKRKVTEMLRVKGWEPGGFDLEDWRGSEF